jgi:transposase
MEYTPYPSDLTDKEWQWIESWLPAPCKTGQPRQYPLRAILNAIFYVLRTGCQWRAMLHDLAQQFPQWTSSERSRNRVDWPLARHSSSYYPASQPSMPGDVPMA